MILILWELNTISIDSRIKFKKVYGIDFEARLGPDDGDTEVARLLNRIIEWKHDGICMEADPRHAEIIVKHLQSKDCAPSTATNERINPKVSIYEDLKELSKEGASDYRAVAARGNYLSIDRSDIRYIIRGERVAEEHVQAEEYKLQTGRAPR